MSRKYCSSKNIQKPQKCRWKEEGSEHNSICENADEMRAKLKPNTKLEFSNTCQIEKGQEQDSICWKVAKWISNQTHSSRYISNQAMKWKAEISKKELDISVKFFIIAPPLTRISYEIWWSLFNLRAFHCGSSGGFIPFDRKLRQKCYSLLVIHVMKCPSKVFQKAIERGP